MCILPPLRVRDVDHLAWQKLEALLRNPEWELELLQKAQAKQKAQHTDAVTTVEDIEQAKARYEAELDRYYLEW